MSPWHIELLAGMRATRDGVVVDHFRTQRAALLLAYLALKPGRAYAREALAEMLWPEEDPIQQRKRLRYELTMLRRALGEEAVVTHGAQDVSLHESITSDVSQFESANAASLRAHSAADRIPLLRTVAELYRGELLPGRYLPEGCPPEQDWISQHRDRLAGDFARAVKRLVNDLETLGHWDESRQLRQTIRQRCPEIDLPDAPTLSNGSPKQPAEQGAFFGRKAEQAAIDDWLEQPIRTEARLLTLTGPGGMGKTRLSREVTRGRSAVFVPLADSERHERIWEVLHQELSLPRRSSLGLPDQAIAALRSRAECVIVLDNLEHLLPAVAADIEKILTDCPRTRILATSRRTVGIAGEREIAIGPLPVEESTTLFVERARSVRREFARTPQGQTTVREIARLLEGLPLALELAAARASVLAPAQLLDQLKNRLRFLVHRPGSPEREERHQSVRAALEWSFDLLTPSARTALTRLSVFRGGFSFSAGLAVCGDEPPLVDTLEELCLHSLVRCQSHHDTSYSDRDPSKLDPPSDEPEELRYESLFVVREFAFERLTITERKSVERRHAEYFRDCGAALDATARAWRGEPMRRRLLPDIHNFRAAATFAVHSDDPELAWSLMETTVVPFFEMGYWEEVEDLLTHTESVASLAEERLERYLGLCGALARRRGAESAATQFWERRCALCRARYATAQNAESDSEKPQAADRLVDALFDLAGQAVDLREWDRASGLLEEGAEVLAKFPLPVREIPRLALTARLRQAAGDATGAREALQLAETLGSQIEHEDTPYFSLYALPVYRAQGDRESALRLLWRALRTVSSNTHLFIQARFLTELGRFVEKFVLPEIADKEEGMQTALTAYYIAFQIHAELRSRLEERSRMDWDRLSRLHPVLTDTLDLTSQPWERTLDQLRASWLRDDSDAYPTLLLR